MNNAIVWMLAVFGLSTFANGCGHGHDDCKTSVVVQQEVKNDNRV